MSCAWPWYLCKVLLSSKVWFYYWVEFYKCSLSGGFLFLTLLWSFSLATEIEHFGVFVDFWVDGFSGIYIINLGKTWEKLHLAARIIVAIENPQDIIVQSARPYGQRAVLKFAQYTGAHAIAGRHTPGTFTNQMQTSYNEPRLLILTDPRTDHQVIYLL